MKWRRAADLPVGTENWKTAGDQDGVYNAKGEKLSSLLRNLMCQHGARMLGLLTKLRPP